MNKQFLGILAAIVVVLIGIGMVSSSDEPGSSDNNGSGEVLASVSNNTTGESSSGVQFIEAGDFECPACASFHPIIKQIKSEYEGRVEFIYKHFPLTQIHVNALAAHRAAFAAEKQGKFWEMHDLLYEQRNLWIAQTSSNPVPQLEQFAADLELDLEQFKADFASTAASDTILADKDEMRDAGLPESTPGFILDGVTIESTRELDSIQKMRDRLDLAIEEKTGVAPEPVVDDPSTQLPTSSEPIDATIEQ